MRLTTKTTRLIVEKTMTLMMLMPTLIPMVLFFLFFMCVERSTRIGRKRIPNHSDVVFLFFSSDIMFCRCSGFIHSTVKSEVGSERDERRNRRHSVILLIPSSSSSFHISQIASFPHVIFLLIPIKGAQLKPPPKHLKPHHHHSFLSSFFPRNSSVLT